MDFDNILFLCKALFLICVFFLACGLIEKIVDHFGKASDIIDAPSDQDTEYDRRWNKLLHGDEVYDQEKER